MRSMRSGSFESFRSVKNLERLSKKQSNNQATDQSGTVDFSCQSPGVNVSPQMFSGFSRYFHSVAVGLDRCTQRQLLPVSLCEGHESRSHAYAQYDGSQNQGTMEVDDNCLAFTRQGFAHAESLNPNFQ